VSAQTRPSMPLKGSTPPNTRSSAAQPRALIDIGARRTTVVLSRGAPTDVLLELPIGTRRIAKELFRQDPPRPAELEAAIDTVEDEVMRVAARVPAGAALLATGTFAGEIRHAVATNDQANEVISLDEVEQLFQRLASASLGNPAARQGLPPGNGFVAAVLILREFMHHLGFASVVFRPESDFGFLLPAVATTQP
jgi:exopolyphosphatase/pppGpp-phosphohydrolase